MNLFKKIVGFFSRHWKLLAFVFILALASLNPNAVSACNNGYTCDGSEITFVKGDNMGVTYIWDHGTGDVRDNQRNLAGVVTIPEGGDGYYVLVARVDFNGPEDQKNESFYLEVEDAEIRHDSPNVGNYKVVVDPGEGTDVYRDAGIFWLSAGEHAIWMNHYGIIAEQGYDSLWVGDFWDGTPGTDQPESVSLRGIRFDPICEQQDEIDLELTKKVNGEDYANVYVGDEVSYDITVINNGPDDATGVQVRDQIVSGLAFYQDQDNFIDYNLSSGVWDVGDLVSGQSKTLTVRALVIGAGEIVNTAEVINADQDDVDSTPDNGNPSEDDQDSATVQVIEKQIDLSLNKEVSDSELTVGDTTTFTVTVTNDGPDNATDVKVSDMLPQELGYVSDDSGSKYNSDTGIWNVGGLNVGVSKSIDIVVEALEAGQFINIAEVYAAGEQDVDSTPNNGDPEEDDQDDAVVSVEEPIIPYYNLSITKTADKNSAMIGELVTYNLDWSAVGNMATTADIYISDVIATSTDFVSAKVDNIDVGFYNASNREFKYNLGSIDATDSENNNGTIVLTVVVNNFAAEGQIIENMAMVTSNGLLDTSRDDFLVTDYNVEIEKTAPALAYAGDQITYEIKWKVTGNMTTLEPVIITDVLPEGVNFISAEPAYLSAHYSFPTRTFELNLGILSPEDEREGTIYITVELDPSLEPGDDICNVANIDSANKHDDDCGSTTVTEVPYFNLSVDKQANLDEVMVGGSLVYTINWEVTGNMTTANDVILSDQMPVNVDFVSADQGSYDEPSRTWSLNLGQIDATDSQANHGSVTLNVDLNGLAEQGTSIVNTVVIESGQEEDEDSATSLVTDYNVEIEKTAPANAYAGDEITYTINWEVTGNMTSLDPVVVTDVMPTEVEFVSAEDGDQNDLSSNYDDSTRTFTLNLGYLSPEDEREGTIYITVELDPSLEPGDDILNTALIESGNVSDQDDATTTISASTEYFYNIYIEKSAPAEVKAGSNISYTIDWSVTGNMTAPAVVVTDDLPLSSNISFVSASGVYTIENGVLTWELGDIDPSDSQNASGSFEVVLSTSEDTGDGTEAVNLVNMSSGEADVSAEVTTVIRKETVRITTGGGGGGGGSFTSNPRIRLEYFYPLEKTVGSEYLETINVFNIGNVILTNGLLVVDLPQDNVNFVRSSVDGYDFDSDEQIITWSIPAIAAGKDFSVDIWVTGTRAGSDVITTVEYDADQRDAETEGSEDVVDGILPPPPTPPVPTPPQEPTPPSTPEEPTSIPVPAPEPPVVEKKVVVAPAATVEPAVIEPECEQCQPCEVEDECAGCSWLVWLIVILLHIMSVFVYWFYGSKEEIKENENGEYRIIKGNFDWFLPVLLLLAIIFLILVYICHLIPWWALAVIMVSYLIALLGHQKIVKQAEVKYSPILPIFTTIAVLIAYIVCPNWAWWVWLVILVLYILTLVVYYLVVVKMTAQKRNLWWLVVPMLTILLVGLEMLLRLCQCQEVIR